VYGVILHHALGLRRQQVFLLSGEGLRTVDGQQWIALWTSLPVKLTATFSIQPSSLVWTLAILVSSSVTRAAARMERWRIHIRRRRVQTPMSCCFSGGICKVPGFSSGAV